MEQYLSFEKKQLIYYSHIITTFLASKREENNQFLPLMEYLKTFSEYIKMDYNL